MMLQLDMHVDVYMLCIIMLKHCHTLHLTTEAYKNYAWHLRIEPLALSEGV